MASLPVGWKSKQCRDEVKQTDELLARLDEGEAVEDINADFDARLAAAWANARQQTTPQKSPAELRAQLARDIAELMGHSKIEMTGIYIHPSLGSKKQAVGKALVMYWSREAKERKSEKASSLFR